MKKKLVQTLIIFIAIAFSVFYFSSIYLMGSAEPKVALLHTTKEWIPNFIFRIASTPLAIVSLIKFGAPVFALVPATETNIKRTINQSEFVVIGTHGLDGNLYSDEKNFVGPTEIQNINMRFVYFGSCYFGAKRSEWQRSLPNADLVGENGEAYQIASGLFLFVVAPFKLLLL